MARKENRNEIKKLIDQFGADGSGYGDPEARLNDDRKLQVLLQFELIEALQKASDDSGVMARRLVWLTGALVFVGVLQAIAGGWPYIFWWFSHGTKG